MFQRFAKVAGVLLIAAVTLTACTPPMPPEVKAALLEQTYTCIDGSSTVSVPEALADDFPNVQGSVSANCPSMSVDIVDSGAKPHIVVSSVDPAATNCSADTSVPYAVDAAVISVSLADAGGVILSPKTAGGILDGSIKRWDDPRITKDNGMVLSTGPIKLVSATDKSALAAFSVWYQHLTGNAFKSAKLKAKPALQASDLGELPEGSVALIPYSVYSYYSVTAMTIPLAASILTDPKANPAGVLPDVSGIGSAASQLDYSKSGARVSTKLNFNIKPVPPLGSDVAPEPYQAIYPVNIYLCGKPSKVTRAVARFMLRQDSLGSLTTLVAPSETLRAESLDVVSVGLPQPKVEAPQN